MPTIRGGSEVTTDTPTIELRESKPVEEILRIDPDGRLFWRGREVETDAGMREALLDLAHILREDYLPPSYVAVPRALLEEVYYAIDVADNPEIARAVQRLLNAEEEIKQ